MTRLRFVRTWAAWGVLALAAVALPRAAAAATIAFDTFGPGDTFSTSVYGVDGAAGFQAFHFVPTATGTLEQITVALGRTGASQATTIFELYTAPTNLALGALLETFVVANTAPPDNLQPFTLSLVTFQSAVMPQLTAGQGYWLSFMEAEAADGASFALGRELDWRHRSTPDEPSAVAAEQSAGVPGRGDLGAGAGDDGAAAGSHARRVARATVPVGHAAVRLTRRHAHPPPRADS